MGKYVLIFGIIMNIADGIILPIDALIFFKMVKTTNQIGKLMINLWIFGVLSFQTNPTKKYQVY